MCNIISYSHTEERTKVRVDMVLSFLFLFCESTFSPMRRGEMLHFVGVANHRFLRRCLWHVASTEGGTPKLPGRFPPLHNTLSHLNDPFHALSMKFDAKAAPNAS